MEKFYIWLAWKLPKRVMHWAVIRVFAHASMHLPDREVSSLNWDEALKVWDK